MTRNPNQVLRQALADLAGQEMQDVGRIGAERSDDALAFRESPLSNGVHGQLCHNSP